MRRKEASLYSSPGCEWTHKKVKSHPVLASVSSEITCCLAVVCCYQKFTKPQEGELVFKAINLLKELKPIFSFICFFAHAPNWPQPVCVVQWKKYKHHSWCTVSLPFHIHKNILSIRRSIPDQPPKESTAMHTLKVCSNFVHPFSFMRNSLKVLLLDPLPSGPNKIANQVSACAHQVST